MKKQNQKKNTIILTIILDVQPTIWVEAGSRATLMIEEDLILEKYDKKIRYLAEQNLQKEAKEIQFIEFYILLRKEVIENNFFTKTIKK